MSNESISEKGLEEIKIELLEKASMVCRNCGERLHLVNFKQRGFLNHGGAIAGGELSCPNQRWWKIWENHRVFWVEVTSNGYSVWEEKGFREVPVQHGRLEIPWYKILVGEHY